MAIISNLPSIISIDKRIFDAQGTSTGDILCFVSLAHDKSQTALKGNGKRRPFLYALLVCWGWLALAINSSIN